MSDFFQFVCGLDRDVHFIQNMNFFYLCPEDRDWLKGWLMKHVFLVVLILCFWLILNVWPKAETPVSLVDDSTVVQSIGEAHSSGERSTIGKLDRVLAQGEDGPQARRLVQLPSNSVNVVERDRAMSFRTLERSDTGYVAGAVQPTGWRRTRNGWENAATWRTSLASLGDIVRQQQEREPDWFQHLLARVRGVPPWGVALLQLIAVAGVLLFEKRAARQRPRQAIAQRA